ncbi:MULTISPECIES: hypothetical protein [unclassified Streptomyces]|uniref:hypothetical protein n=1 Tax=unclassified Streptomyces TaxID=2593676 RepID=UPI0013A6B51C|nr:MULTISPECIES: hypothetical protein [unclassified Streptomyces]
MASGQRFGLANAQQISFAAVLDVTPERMRYPAAAAAIYGIEGPHDNKKGFAKALRGWASTPASRRRSTTSTPVAWAPTCWGCPRTACP